MNRIHNMGNLLEKFSSRRRSSTGLNKLNAWSQNNNEIARRASEAIASSSDNFNESFNKAIESINIAINEASIHDYGSKNRAQSFDCNNKNSSSNSVLNCAKYDPETIIKR